MRLSNPVQTIQVSMSEMQSEQPNAVGWNFLRTDLFTKRYEQDTPPLPIMRGIQMDLKTMSVDKLLALKSQVETALSSKVADERRALETKLAHLSQFDSRSRPKLGGGRRGAVAPKYRNPNNPGETWAGRGLKPRWLVAAIKSGKKAEEFLIKGATVSKGNGRKKLRNAKKAA
jgi:DNA-binding protein H-NS